MAEEKREYGTGSLKLKPGCKNWIAVYRLNGRQIERSTHTDSKMRAEAKLREFLAGADNGKAAPSQRVRFSVLDQALLADYRRKENRSLIEHEDGSWDTSMGWAHVRDYFAALPVSKVNSKSLDAYVAHRRKQGASNGTINRELAQLRRAFKVAVQREDIAVSQMPTYWPMQKEAEPREGFFEHSDFQRLLTEMPTYTHAILMFMYWTGCRRGAARLITWNQIDLQRGTMALAARQLKNKKPLTLPLPEELLALLRAVPVAERQGFAFYSGDFKKSWHSACRKLGLGDMLVHDMRRTAARNLINAGVPETVVMQITGHRTRSMLTRYGIVDDRQLRSAMVAVQQHVLNGSGQKQLEE